MAAEPAHPTPRVGPWWLVAVPGVLLGVLGSVHPATLTAADATRWWVIHVVGLFVFPLLALAVWAPVRGRRDPLARLITLAAFVFACAYSALDVLAGIGAGWLVDHGVAKESAALRHVFDIGHRLGEVGAWSLVVATLVIATDAMRRGGVAVLPASLMVVVGGVAIEEQHLYWPYGALGAALLGLGLALLVRVLPAPRS